jgi:hypothetical protein
MSLALQLSQCFDLSLKSGSNRLVPPYTNIGAALPKLYKELGIQCSRVKLGAKRLHIMKRGSI